MNHVFSDSAARGISSDTRKMHICNLDRGNAFCSGKLNKLSPASPSEIDYRHSNKALQQDVTGRKRKKKPMSHGKPKK